MIRFLAAFAFVATPLSAQVIDETAPAIRAIFDAAKAECLKETTDDPGAPTPELIIEPGAVTWVDLDGSGGPDDTVIDFNFVLCSSALTLWHGSGGSILHFVLNGEESRSWTGGYWRVSEFRGSPVILIGRHGTWCDSFGARGCVQAIVADEEGFWTVKESAPLEGRKKGGN